MPDFSTSRSFPSLMASSIVVWWRVSTVQYRLKRINDVLGAEITGNRVIPALTIALALKRLEIAEG